MKAVNDRILIKKDTYPELKNGIYRIVSDDYQAPPYTGEVVSIGPDINDPDIQIGSKIGFHDLSGIEFHIGESRYMNIRYQDITFIF